MDPALALEVAALSRQNAVNKAIEKGDSDIQQFYSGVTVFVTGGSGFLGKLLIEKLLRSELRQIAVADWKRRLEQLSAGHATVGAIQLILNEWLEKRHGDLTFRLTQIFNQLRKIHPHFADRIVSVEGDVGEVRLGMSDHDWSAVSQQVDLIFHVAATTRFDESLKLATMINVRGTRELINLAKDCHKLRSFVHVSTAYSYATNDRIGFEVAEQFYPCPVPPDAMIQLAEGLDCRLDAITSDLMRNWPNSYTFTKAIAEEAVRTMATDLPVCIVRPSIVVCTQSEPAPGWLDASCAYGASGIIVGSGIGVMRVLYASTMAKISLVPADYVINALMAAAWETANNNAAGDKETKIYTIASVARNPVSWEYMFRTATEFGKKLPTPKAIWFTGTIQTYNKCMFMLMTWLLHFIPAYILDGVCLLTGKKRRFTKLYTKIYKMTLSLSYFTRNSWNFTDRNSEYLFKKMSKIDKDIYNFNIIEIKWSEYIYLWCVGIRKYIVKDGLMGTKYALKKQGWFRVANYLVLSLYAYGLLKMFYLIITVLCYVFL